MKGIYIVGGYPDMESFRTTLKTVAKTNIDFIEIGIPFSDPVADGPVITAAIEESLSNGSSSDQILSVVNEEIDLFRSRKIKFYVMTYSNVILGYGLSNFSEKYSDIIDGLIIPDIPNRMHSYFYGKGLRIGLIPFVTPESRDKDIELLDQLNGDFIYYVGVRGITGSNSGTDYGLLSEHTEKIRQSTDKKVVFGFGIRSSNDVTEALKYADGVVIGTAVVKLQKDNKKLVKYLNQVFD